MISFKAFINAIQDAILTANDSLMEKNTGLLDKYFEAPGDESDIRRVIDEALKTSKSVITKKENSDQEDYKKVVKGLEYAKNALGDKDLSSSEASTALSPKSVVVEYPRQTPTGIEYTEVHVPLITLVPLSMSQIKEAKLTSEFEMEIVDDELQLHFDPSKARKGKMFGKKRATTYGRLEITITPHESSEGLKHLVEGYEKALKAQIPH